MKSRLALAALAVLIQSWILPPSGWAAPGDLDLFFGGNGKVATNFTSGDDMAFGVAIQSDGRIVAVGSADFQNEFALARYTRDGSLDASFDGDGKLTTTFTGDHDSAHDLAIQADGKIVAAGTAGFDSYALARYESDGSLDPSFSGDGKVLTNFTRGVDLALGIAIQSNRRIVAAGHAGGTRASPRNHKFAIARYRANGALDRSFSGDGKRVLNFTSGDDWAQDVAIQPDGKIVAAGRAAGAGGRFALARFWAT